MQLFLLLYKEFPLSRIISNCLSLDSGKPLNFETYRPKDKLLYLAIGMNEQIFNSVKMKGLIRDFWSFSLNSWPVLKSSLLNILINLQLQYVIFPLITVSRYFSKTARFFFHYSKVFNSSRIEHAHCCVDFLSVRHLIVQK